MFMIFVQKIYNISLATIITGPSAYWGLLCAYLLFFAAAVPRGRVCHIGGVLFGLLQILVQLLLGHHARAGKALGGDESIHAQRKLDKDGADCVQIHVGNAVFDRVFTCAKGQQEIPIP